MKKNNKILMGMIFSVACQCTIEAGPDAMGVKAVREADAVLQKHLPAVTAASAAFGSQFGTGALTMIGAGITKASATIAAGAKVADATAVAIATSPYTAGAAAGVVVGVGGYKAYKHYYPTEQEKAAAQAETASLLKLAEQHKAEAEAFRKRALEMKRGRELLEVRAEFGSCMTSNRRRSLGSMGVPSACEGSAAALAFMGQYAEVEQASQFIQKYKG